MHNILVTGANGQLGSEIKELGAEYPYKFFFTSKEELNIANYDDTSNYVVQNSIDVIVNCAAYTKVDNAEDEIELANSVNHLAVKNLAKISKENSIKLVHISTDYVFDGTNFKPYQENDQTNPKSVYGQTKLDGEIAMCEINPQNSIIIRTSWVYSSYGNNFVKTISNLAKTKESLNVIFDQIGTPTYARHLAKIILEIIPNIDNKKVQIYNYSNEGVISWFDFAKEIVKIANFSCKINPIETKDYPTKANRPHYSVLNKAKIKSDFNIEIPYWKDGLEECLKEIK